MPLFSERNSDTRAGVGESGGGGEGGSKRREGGRGRKVKKEEKGIFWRKNVK